MCDQEEYKIYAPYFHSYFNSCTKNIHNHTTMFVFMYILLLPDGHHISKKCKQYLFEPGRQRQTTQIL